MTPEQLAEIEKRDWHIRCPRCRYHARVENPNNDAGRMLHHIREQQAEIDELRAIVRNSPASIPRTPGDTSDPSKT